LTGSGGASERFDRFVGIDYSGASTPLARLPGLRVYCAEGDADAVEVPAPGPRRHWSRRGVAEWLVERLREATPLAVGIDHGFSFPLAYFERHGLALDWPAFLEDFRQHWPTDGDDARVEQVRLGTLGRGALRTGDSRWRRLTELRARSPKSVFHFDVQGSVAKSTHAGLPWLLHVRRQIGERAHFWPFDGFDVPEGRSLVAEVYPSLWSRHLASGSRTPDQHDAYAVATWLRAAARDRRLESAFRLQLEPAERSVAKIEGWILGVGTLLEDEAGSTLGRR